MAKRAEGLEVHQRVNDPSPRQQAAELFLPFPNRVGRGSAANAQNANAISWHRETGQSIDETDHDGIVGPETTIHEGVATIFERPVVRRSCGSRGPDLGHEFVAVEPEIGMMGSLEDVQVAMPTIGGRHAEPDPGFSELCFAECVGQGRRQGPAVVPVTEILREVAGCAARWWEDLASTLGIEVKKLRSTKACAESERDDTPR